MSVVTYAEVPVAAFEVYRRQESMTFSLPALGNRNEMNGCPKRQFL